MDEFELIERLTAKLPKSGPRVRLGPGDDAAVTEPGGATATTVDALIEGVHFTLPEFPPAAVGRKALAAGLSDLAAMGAEPGEAYVAVGLPQGLDQEFALALHAGMRELAAGCGVELIGGDVSRAPVLIVAVTAVGHEHAGVELVTRGGASPGDVVAVTGELGGAAAALRILRSGGEGERRLLDRQLAPQPRLDAGLALAKAGATAMIDISDGLGADAERLAKRSRARLEIELSSVPVQPGAELEQAASGGEDYELLACLPPERLDEAKAAVEATGVALTEIGSVSAGTGVSLRTAGGAELEPRGFDHLA